MPTTPNSHTETPKKRSAVQPDEIIAHLRILAVFHKLKLDVQARSPHNPTGLWTAFLGYAVEKFASWITNVVDKQDSETSDELTEEEFPTLDVAMVWHAYILNPLEYHKDCQKSHSGLMRIKAFPVQRLADVIDTLGLEPRFPVPAFGSRGVRIGPQFSLDLVAAVKRQASFVAQVAAVGWTQRPKNIHDVAHGSIDKYHSFLKKLWENPNYLAVPTLEIDLAWHTHQLNIEQYRQDSVMLFGRILQHDDDIPSPELNKAFRRNSYDWQNLFHMDYQGGTICTGFRPVSVSAPGTPNGMKRSGTRDSSRTSSEVWPVLHRIGASENSNAVFHSDFTSGAITSRIRKGADGSSRDSSISVSTPSSSGRDSTPSPDLDFHSLAPGSRPSSAGKDSPLPRVNTMMQMLRPGNDSTATISPYPSSNGFGTSASSPPDSRRSSTSELGSIFAYTPPKGWNDSRGAFDRPANSCLKPSNAMRPSSAGNNLPSRSSLRQPRHQLSNSTGTLYVPEMPSPLSQPPEMNLDTAYYGAKHQPQLIRRPSNLSGSRQSSQERTTAANTRANMSRSSSAVSMSPPPSSFPWRPSSGGGGNAGARAPPAHALPKRPSTSSGVGVGMGGMSISGSMKLFGRGSLSRATTPDSKMTAGVSEIGTMKHPTPSRAGTMPNGSTRPSTAPPPTTIRAQTMDGDERSRSGGLFRKKSKGERSPSAKRSWFRFW